MKRLILLVMFVWMIGGCGSEEKGMMLEEPKPLEVNVTVQPEEVKIGEEFTVIATVTMGEEKVEDASEVVFELRKSGEEKNEMIEGENKKKGNYEMKSKVDEAGTYIIITHVTARNLHIMPKIEFTVE